MHVLSGAELQGDLRLPGCQEHRSLCLGGCSGVLVAEEQQVEGWSGGQDHRDGNQSGGCGSGHEGWVNPSESDIKSQVKGDRQGIRDNVGELQAQQSCELVTLQQGEDLQG